MVGNNPKAPKKNRRWRGAALAALALLAAPVTRAAWVMVEKGNIGVAYTQLSTPLPTDADFIQNASAVGGNIVRAGDAIGVDETVDDMALTVKTVGGIIWNATPFAGNERTQMPGTIFGGNLSGTAVDLMQQRDRAVGDASNWIAVQGDTPAITLMQQYRSLYLDDLATQNENGSVTFSAHFGDLRDFAVNARQDGFDPALLLAISNIIYDGTGTSNGQSPMENVALVESQLKELGAAYLRDRQLQQSGLYSADTDPNLQIIAAARTIAIDMAFDKRGHNGGTLAITDGGIINTAREIMNTAQDAEFRNQAAVEFNSTIVNTAYADIANNDAYLLAFMQQRDIQLTGVAANMVMAALGNDEASRLGFVRRFTEAGGVVGQPLQDMRQARIDAQPLNRLASFFSSPAHADTGSVSAAASDAPRVSPAATSLLLAISLGDYGKGNVGEALLQNIRENAPDLEDMLTIATTGTVNELEAAAMTAAIARDGLPRDAAALQEATRDYLQIVTRNILVGDDYSNLALRVYNGNRTMHPELQADLLLDTVSRIYEGLELPNQELSGRLSARVQQLYSITPNAVSSLVLYITANEGNFNCVNPPLLNANASALDPANRAGPVFGCGHFIQNTLALSVATAYSAGFADSGFMQRVSRPGFVPAADSDDNVRLTMLRAAFGADAVFTNTGRSMTVMRHGERVTSFNFDEPGAEQRFATAISDRIASRLADVAPSMEAQRFMWTPLDAHFGAGRTQAELTQAAFLRARRDMPNRDVNNYVVPPVELIEFMGLAYSQKVTANAVLGQFINARDELQGIWNENPTTPEAVFTNVAHLYMYHVFGGTLQSNDGWVDVYNAGRWTSDIKRERNTFVTERDDVRLTPRQALAEKSEALMNTARAIGIIQMLESSYPGVARNAAVSAAENQFSESGRPLPPAPPLRLAAAEVR